MVACSFRRSQNSTPWKGGGLSHLIIRSEQHVLLIKHGIGGWQIRKMYPSPEQDAYTIYMIIYQIYHCMILKIVLVCIYIYVHMNYMLWRLSILSGWKAFYRPSQNPQTPAWLYHFEIVTGCLILNIEFKFSCTSHLPNSSPVSQIAMVESCGPHVVNWITSPG